MAFQTKAPWYANGTITSDGTAKIVGLGTNWTDVGAISLGDMLTLDGLSFYQVVKIGDGTVQGDGSAGTANGTQAGNNTIIYVDRVVATGSGQAYGVLQLSAVNPINSDIAYKVSSMVQSWQGREDELIAWLAGTAGTFTLTDATGVAYQVKCPAQMQADVDAKIVQVQTDTDAILTAISGGIDSVLGVANTTQRRMTIGGIDLAPITALLPPITIVASDYFDNSQDSAWIDRCADKSWELEARSGVILSSSNYANATAAVAAGIVTGDGFYNTTTAQFEEVTGATTSTITDRAGSRKFPMEVLATAEAGRVIIWDSTSGQLEMWKTYITGAQFFLGGSATVSSVAISGHKIAIGTTANGSFVWDFVEDSSINRVSTGTAKRFDMSNANSSTPAYSVINPSNIVSNAVNSVAITYLPDAPLDEYGMRVPTIAVGTAGGVSVIKHDGSVVNITATFVPSIHKVHFYADRLGFTQTDDNALYLLPVPSVSLSSAGYYSAITGIRPYYAGGYPALLGASVAKGLVRSATYSNLGLCLLHENPTTPANGMVAYLTNTYNTGWMVGDIRRAYLCNSLTADRSVKGSTLTMTGTITETVNAGGVNYYASSTNSEFLTEAYSADLDFGVGDFCVMGWAFTNGLGTSRLLDRADADGSHRFLLMINAGQASILTSGALNTQSYVFSPVLSYGWHLICGVRMGGMLTLYVDGAPSVLSTSVSPGAGYDITSLSGTGTLTVSGKFDGTGAGGQLGRCLLRISATAPTPEQIKHMYETERKLFEPNAQALLSSSPNVTDLKYNKQHDTYYAKNGTNVDEFKGLVRTDSMALATGVTTSGNPLAAPVLSSTGTTNIFKAPAVDMNSSIKALGLQLADAKQGTVIKTITSSAASVLTMPQGFKPIRVTAATGTYVSLSTNSPKYDGFIWSITTGLAANTAYDVEMRRV